MSLATELRQKDHDKYSYMEWFFFNAIDQQHESFQQINFDVDFTATRKKSLFPLSRCAFHLNWSENPEKESEKINKNIKCNHSEYHGNFLRLRYNMNSIHFNARRQFRPENPAVNSSFKGALKHRKYFHN